MSIFKDERIKDEANEKTFENLINQLSEEGRNRAIMKAVEYEQVLNPKYYEMAEAYKQELDRRWNSIDREKERELFEKLGIQSPEYITPSFLRIGVSLTDSILGLLTGKFGYIAISINSSPYNREPIFFHSRKAKKALNICELVGDYESAGEICEQLGLKEKSLGLL